MTTTSHERWHAIDQLFEAALDHAPSERAAFLAEACGTDTNLQREVASLLAAAEQSENFIEESPLPAAMKLGKLQTLPSSLTNSLIGQRLGHYELTALLGAGGMGEVYRAHDARLGREVAVKVLPPHLARNHEAVSRFEREARAVAALSHPNILAIHDVGVEGELHYAVMELLEGARILRRLAETKALAPFILEEVRPGVAVGDLASRQPERS